MASIISDAGQGDTLLSQLTTLDQVLGVLLSGSGGLIDILAAFDERGEDIAGAIAELEEAERVLDDLASGGDGTPVAGNLSDISKLVTDLRVGLQLVNSFAPVRSALLGTDGVQEYLVLGQSADELRGTGGFVSSIWQVTFGNGGLDGIKYEDSVRVDDWGRLELYPKAPPGLDEHMNAWVWLLRDVSWDPDFPTTASTAEDMYHIGQRQDVDGVIAINQWSLLRLVEALGSIPSPGGGEPVTSRNLLSVLEEGTDEHGRAYMDLVLQGLLDKMNQPMSMPALIRLASALNDTLRQRDTLIYFDDPGLQSVAREFGWDGSVRQDSMDYLYVVDSNVGWSKVDRNIQRDVSYIIDMRRDGRPRASLTLGYDNHSGPNSPGCEPQWLNRGTDYTQFKNACYWNFLRVYIPQGSTLLSATPMRLPEYSVSVEIDRGVPGQDTGRISSSHNKLMFSGLTAIEAGDRREINLVYDLPASALRREGDTITYQLLIQKQLGVRQRKVSVDFILPEGYELGSSSVSPVQLGDSRVSLALVLDQDTMIDVEFKKSSDESD